VGKYLPLLQKMELDAGGQLRSRSSFHTGAHPEKRLETNLFP